MNICRVPLECDAGGYNAFKDHDLGNSTELDCMGNFQFGEFDEGHFCSSKAWCKAPQSYGPLVPTLPNNFEDEQLFVEGNETV